MKSKLLACTLAASLSLISISAFAATYQCTSVNPVRNFHYTYTYSFGDPSRAYNTAFNQAQSRCLSVTANPANCHTSCVNLGGPVSGAAPVVAGNCIVRDLAGRTWSGYTCAGATDRCNNWHLNHGIVNGVCNVIAR